MSTAPVMFDRGNSRTTSGIGLMGSIEEALHGLQAEPGVRHAAFIVWRVPGVIDELPLQATSFGPDWLSTYERLDFGRFDPTIRVAVTSTTAVDWRDIPRRGARERRFFSEMQAARAGTEGVSFPFRGPWGDTSLVLVSADVSRLGWPSLREEIARQVAGFHAALHRRTMIERFGLAPARAVPLTRRQLQCLALAARGLTSRAIGSELGLSVTTVNFFFDQAIEKLGAGNRTHAVALALQLGIISGPVHQPR
jgi:DNA-binding CsgD family transcriptional regulator